MRRYEGLFIFPPDETPETAKEGEKRLEEMLSRFGGRSVERHDGGRRPLGYPIRKFREGRMLVWNFEMETSRLGEFRKALELEEKILKSMIVKASEPKPDKAPRRKLEPPKGVSKTGLEGVHGR